MPDPLPGEDRTFGSGLFADLVPSTCWFTNVRACVVPRDWERLRRMIVNRAGRRCEACGHSDDRSGGRWLEAHERWHYENQTSTQILRRLVCLCTGCHGTTHFGLASLRGEAEQALGHLRAVTGMTRREAEDHVDAAYEIWTQRSRTQWTLDLGLLTGAGITLATPMTAADRERAVQDTLRRVGPPT